MKVGVKVVVLGPYTWHDVLKNGLTQVRLLLTPLCHYPFIRRAHGVRIRGRGRGDVTGTIRESSTAVAFEVLYHDSNMRIHVHKHTRMRTHTPTYPITNSLALPVELVISMKDRRCQRAKGESACSRLKPDCGTPAVAPKVNRKATATERCSSFCDQYKRLFKLHEPAGWGGGSGGTLCRSIWGGATGRRGGLNTTPVKKRPPCNTHRGHFATGSRNNRNKEKQKIGSDSKLAMIGRL